MALRKERPSQSGPQAKMIAHPRTMCFALFACFALAALLAGIAKTTTGKACNERKTGAFKRLDTNVVFQTAIFLILVIRHNKRSSGIDSKTSNCLSRNCLYYRCLELRFC